MTQRKQCRAGAAYYLPEKREKMSPLLLICIGILLFVATNGVNISQKENPRRARRSLIGMNSMFQDLTGHKSTEFINYGRYCGIGGSGKPVDSLDTCCQSHDICYNEINQTTCASYRLNAVYSLNYDWKIENNEILCGKTDDLCEATLCVCDATLVNCLNANLPFYNSDNYHPISFLEMIREGNYLSNL